MSSGTVNIPGSATAILRSFFRYNIQTRQGVAPYGDVWLRLDDAENVAWRGTASRSKASRGAAVKFHNHFHIFETNPEVPAPELFCAGNFFF
jgi:hypothetical protein